MKRTFPNPEAPPFKDLDHGKIMAHRELLEPEGKYTNINGENKMMILPSAALYLALRRRAPERALPKRR